jgi:putative endonuclease
MSASSSPAWWLYVLLSVDGDRTYVGITTDPDRRLRAHNGELAGGARSTRAHRPWRLGAVYGPYPDRALVSRAEWYLKRTRSGLRRLEWAAVEMEYWRPNALSIKAWRRSSPTAS